MTATVLLEIVVRTFFGTTTHAAEELVGFGLASVEFLALAHAMDRGSLIRVDLILVRLSGCLRRAVELVSIVVALSVTSFVGGYVFLAIVRYWNRNTVSAPSAFAAALLLSTTMGYLHMPQTVAAWIAGLELSPVELIIVLGIFYIVLGCVLESITLILMTMPISFPLIVQAGFDPVWFGVFLVLVVEMGLVTPPIGFNLFVIRGVTGHGIGRIARGAFPFFLLMLLATVLITAFPEIALWLPQTLFDR